MQQHEQEMESISEILDDHEIDINSLQAADTSLQNEVTNLKTNLVDIWGMIRTVLKARPF